jgi:hypothetical protein
MICFQIVYYKEQALIRAGNLHNILIVSLLSAVNRIRFDYCATYGVRHSLSPYLAIRGNS